MPISLSKGQKVSLTKGNPSLKNIMVGLGWDVNAFDSGADFDLDASAFLVGSNGKCITEKDFVFYGNLEHPSGAVKHMGDNLTGGGDGDDVAGQNLALFDDSVFQCLHVFLLFLLKLRFTDSTLPSGRRCRADCGSSRRSPGRSR